MNKFIAIDIGSSFVKAVLLNLKDSKILAQKRILAPQKLPDLNPNKFTVRAEEYLICVRQLITEQIQALGTIDGMLFSTQMHGFVYEPDNTDKDPLYISWQDQRCIDLMPHTKKSYLSHLKTLIKPADMAEHGVYLKPSLALCNLYTMLSEDTSINRNGTLYTLGSWLSSRLGARNICHPQNAAPLGLFNLKTKTWNRSLLYKVGLPGIKLPELVSSDHEIIGYTEIAGSKITIFPDFGDQQVSVLGSDLKENQALINIATACQAICRTKKIESGSYEIRPYFSGTHFKTISNLPGGHCLDVLINFLVHSCSQITGSNITNTQVWDTVHRLYQPNPHGLKADLRFYATYDHTEGGAILGINPGNFNAGSLFAAAFDYMGNSYRQAINQLTDLSHIKEIICAGGVAWRLPELMKEIELSCAKPCKLSPQTDEAMRGMLILARYCNNPLRSIEDYAADLTVNS